MVAISARGVGKAYTIAAADVAADAPGTLLGAFAQTLRRRRAGRPAAETFWALREVTFDIPEGVIVGIIGRNGAGKSTLLKILSRITEPTTGEIDLYGRVGSLLEVGTGFHPELTGRENIFLNGSILGMTRREIACQIDAIVDFAGVEKFLETPVKRYSSGMAVRLAFAVAAHLNPDILIVDEVLTVGDAAFQQKCLGKMREVARNGRTVLFVSHQMQSVRSLCGEAMVLDRGQVSYQGDVPGAIDHYLLSQREEVSEERDNPDLRPGSGEFRFIEVTPETPVMNSAGQKRFDFTMHRRRRTNVASSPGTLFFMAAQVVNLREGVVVAQCDSRLVGAWTAGNNDKMNGSLRIATPWLKPDEYRLDIALYASSGQVVDRWEAAYRFDISPLLPYDYPVPGDALNQSVVLADFIFDFD